MSDSRATHYTLRHRVTAAVSRGLFRNFEYTVRHGLLKGMRRKGGLGWLPEWFPGAGKRTAEQAFWEELDLRGKVVWDVGAFEGLLTLHFARHATQVVAWEPNPQTRARLEHNLALNRIGNVLLRPLGIGESVTELTLTEDPLMPGGASAAPKIAAQTASAVHNVRQETIKVTTLDEELSVLQLALPDLIKIDIEGMELAALRGARQLLSAHEPALFIEMHGSDDTEKLDNAAAILGMLRSWGYTRIFHVETSAWLTDDASAVGHAKRGHLYCRT